MPEQSDILDDGAYSRGPRPSFQSVHGVTAVAPCRPSPATSHPAPRRVPSWNSFKTLFTFLAPPPLPTHASVPRGFPETARQGLFNKLTTAADGEIQSSVRPGMKEIGTIKHTALLINFCFGNYSYLS